MDFSILKKWDIKEKLKFKKDKKETKGPKEEGEKGIKNTFIGIDIDSSGIRIIECESSEEEISIGSYGGMDFLSQVKLKDTKDISRKLKNCLLNFDYKDKESNVVFKSKNIDFVLKIFPYVKDKEFIKVMESEMQKDEFDIENNIVDYSVLGELDEQKRKYFVAIVSAPKDEVYKLVSVLEDLKVQPSYIDFLDLVLMRLLKFNEDINSVNSYLMVYNGNIKVSINLIQHAFIRLNRQFYSMGEYDMVNSIAKELKIDFKEAHKIKKELDFGARKDSLSESEKEVFNIVEKFLGRKVIEIERSIQYFMNKYPDSGIEKIFLSGNHFVCGMDVYLNKKIGLPVEIIDPFKKLKLSEKEGKELKKNFDSYSYAVATGLALRDFV